jgi:hypothetical protein
MIKTILETLRDNLALNTTLNTYSVAKYGIKPKIFIGLNRQNPPEVSPSIIIASVLNINTQTTRVFYRIQICYSVSSETITVTGDKNTFGGFIDVEEFREKVEDALFSMQASLGKITLEAQSIDNLIFPLWTSSTILTIEKIKTSRN